MKKSQRGVALLISLLVMSTLTILGMSALRSTDTQQVILKNTQLSQSTDTLSNAELIAQVEVINTNNPGDRDELIISTIDRGVGNPFDIGTNINPVLDIDIHSSSQGFNKSVSTVLIAEPETAIFRGHSLDGFEMVKIEIRSTVTIPNSSTSSVQVQGITYYKPK